MLLAPGAVLAQGRGLRQRRDIATMKMDDPDLLAFREGLREMRSRSDFLSWDNQRQIHARWDRQHGGWRFFPWHRCQLAALEMIIAELSSKADFSLPYWDYQSSPRLPEWLFRDPDFAFTQRDATPATDFAARRWGNEDRLARVFEDSFDRFVGSPDTAGSVEAYGHNRIHGIMGGDMGSVAGATLDPVFWMHHANIDRVWATWHQSTRPQYPAAFLREQISGFVFPRGRLWPIAAELTLETSSFGYEYDALYPYGQYYRTGPAQADHVRHDDRLIVSRNTGSSEASLVLPADWVDAIRASEPGTQSFTGDGEIRFALPNLAGKVVRIMAQSPATPQVKPVTLMSNYAFVHGGHSSGAGHPDDWGSGFDFSYELDSLVRESSGPVVLTAFTTDRGNIRPAAQPHVSAFSLTLGLQQFA